MIRRTISFWLRWSRCCSFRHLPLRSLIDLSTVCLLDDRTELKKVSSAVRWPLSLYGVMSQVCSGYPPSPSKCVLPGNLLAAVLDTAELRSTLESCTEPGHPATTSVKTMFSSQITCTFIEWNFFRLMYASGSSTGALMLICVPSIRPTTPGNPPSSNAALIIRIRCSKKWSKYVNNRHNSTLHIYQTMEKSDCVIHVSWKNVCAGGFKSKNLHNNKNVGKKKRF